MPVRHEQRGGQMSFRVDGAEQGADPHVNYEPSNRNGLREQDRAGPPRGPSCRGMWGARRSLGRTTAPSGRALRTFSDAERDELIANLVGRAELLRPRHPGEMIGHFTQADPDYGRRVAEGLGFGAERRVAAE
jgi:catalase